MRESSLRIGGAALVVLACAACWSDRPSGDATLAVAASLRRVTPELIQRFLEVQGGSDIAVTYGGSGVLRAQIEAGSPIDGVLFAGSEPLDRLIQGGYADPASRRAIATNDLILIARVGAPSLTFETIDRLPAGEMLAIGEPNTVPAGYYARDAFRALGKWEAIKDRLVFGGDVTAVLAYARRGEVAAGVVYRTDTVGISDVVVLDVARGDWAPRPLVVSGVTSNGPAGARAGAFLEFVGSPEGSRILLEHGFGPP